MQKLFSTIEVIIWSLFSWGYQLNIHLAYSGVWQLNSVRCARRYYAYARCFCEYAHMRGHCHSSGMWDERDMRKYGRECGITLLMKRREDWGLVQTSHDRKGGSCKKINGAGKGKSFRGEGILLLLLIFGKKDVWWKRFGTRKYMEWEIIT